MPGQFQRIGATVFPDAEPEIPCGLYEWRRTISEEIGEFSIRFICPEGAGQFRQFFVEPVAESWAKKDKKKEGGERHLPGKSLRSRLRDRRRPE